MTTATELTTATEVATDARGQPDAQVSGIMADSAPQVAPEPNTAEEEELGGPTDEESGVTQSREEEHSGPSQRPAPPSSLLLSNNKTRKKKVLSAPNLSLSLGGGSVLSEDLSAVLSPSAEELELDLEALETPSDSESLVFPLQDLDLDLEADMRRLGVASCRAPTTRRRSLGLEPEDTVDSAGSKWRSFTSNGQETQVNMNLIQDYVRVISHGGYYGDGENDIIVFSSCYLPENSISEYEQVMDHLFRYVMGTLELMVSQNYLVLYLCAGAQKNQVPTISWLRECYTSIDRRLRKNLKGFLVVHPTWFIKALITIIKPFISSKFSRKLRFVDTLLELSALVPIENAQIPDCVKEFDQNL
uniref:CRAL-TRIO domain-containing protein n=1 Tax=Neogobius melanostomus TaxID=47308 RepID=A0A8C6TWZ4_9GOBI